MAENTKIEWADHTFNAWYGCTKVGPPCDNCYAEGWARRSGLVEWGPHGERRRSSAAYWRQPFKWARQAEKYSTTGRRRRVFALSLGDWLDNQVPQEWRADLGDLIRQTPDLDWLLLTKRIQNFDKLAPWNIVPQNVWLGITCGDQAEYDRDWPKLKAIEAPVRFISNEPALGPLYPHAGCVQPDWIIQGGESGPNRREMPLEWARELRDCCAALGIAYFFKQTTGKGEIPDDLMVRQFPTPRTMAVAA